MSDNKDKLYDESAEAEKADNAGVSSEDSPDMPVSFSDGVDGAADNDGASASFDDAEIPEISDDDIEQSLTRIRSEVLALSGLDDAAAEAVINEPKKPAAKRAAAKKGSTSNKPATKKTAAKKTAAKKTAAVRVKPAGVIVFEDFDEDAPEDEISPDDEIASTVESSVTEQPSYIPFYPQEDLNEEALVPQDTPPEVTDTFGQEDTPLEVTDTFAQEATPLEVTDTFGQEATPLEVTDTFAQEATPLEVTDTFGQEATPLEVTDTFGQEATPLEVTDTFGQEATPLEVTDTFAQEDTPLEVTDTFGQEATPPEVTDTFAQEDTPPEVTDTFGQEDTPLENLNGGEEALRDIYVDDDESYDEEFYLVRTEPAQSPAKRAEAFIQDLDEDEEYVLVRAGSSEYDSESGDSPAGSEEHILFDDGTWEEATSGSRPIILFEDVDDDELEEGEKPVVLFQDVDDTYLNQVDLVDRRLEMLRKGSGITALAGENPIDARPGGGIIKFVDEDEVPRGKNLLDSDVDTLIKQLLRRSKQRTEKVIPIEDFNIDASPTWLDHKGGEKAQAVAEIDQLLKHAASDPLLYNLFNAVSGGSNSIVHSIKSEAITLDSEWITTIEDGLYFIEDIVKNPKKFIIDNDIIMEVERARKTTSKTVRHLAQNTKNISKIDDDGFVTPKKVLTTEMEEDLAIYENRFVSTLVGRLTAFVESRKADIQSKFRIYDVSQVSMNSRFKYGPSEVECNFSVAIKELPKDNVLLDKAMYLVNKINDISKRLRILRNSEFMRKLSALKPIVPPIAKTNIIKMNVNYSTCYKLWLFISAYTMVGYSVEVKEKRLSVGGSYFEDLSALTALSMRSLFEHEVVDRDAYIDIVAKPPKTKRFKVVSDFSMSHKAKDRSVEVQDEAINEYYFRKMQELFEEKVSAPASEDDEEEVTAAKRSNVIVEKRNIKINYERYCKSLIQVSNELLSDSINSDAEKQSIIHVDALKRKKRELAKHKEMLKKFSTIAKLKASDLEKTLCEEARHELKLEKLSRELELLEARAEKRKVKRKKPAAKKPEDRKEKAVKKAAEFKQSLIDKQEEERLAEEQRKEERREQRKRDKELKLLAELKYKYKDEPEDTGW